MPKFFLTTAIDYSNGDPHLGHALEKVGADAIARYRRLRGDQVHFLMGMDEHSQSVLQAAATGGALAALGAPALVRAQGSPKIRIGFWPVASGLPFFTAWDQMDDSSNRSRMSTPRPKANFSSVSTPTFWTPRSTMLT